MTDEILMNLKEKVLAADEMRKKIEQVEKYLIDLDHADYVCVNGPDGRYIDHPDCLVIDSIAALKVAATSRLSIMKSFFESL